MNPFELFVGLRYTRAKRRNHFISFISLASMLGIAIGIAALITVLSVMNGFQREVRTRILGVVSHVQVLAAGTPLKDWQKTLAEAKTHPDVIAGAPYVNGQGLFAFGSNVRGGFVRGVLPEFETTVSEFVQHLPAGELVSLKPGEFNIILGSELARGLGARLGEKVTLITPQGQMTVAGMVPRLKQFTLVGVFEAGHFEYDSTLALINIEDAQKLFRVEDGVTGVRLKTTNLFDAPRIARELATRIHADAFVRDWSQENPNYFRAVEIEKRMMFIILTLIIAVAAFNLVSTLVMVVTDKQSDIAILRTLGASPASIQRIFMVQGTIIGVIGTLLGVVGGVLLAKNIDTIVPAVERMFRMQVLSREVYFITDLPSQLNWSDVGWVGVVALILAFLATLYPSRRAAMVNPAEALRYE